MIQLVHQFLNAGNNGANGRHQNITKTDCQFFQLGLQDGHLSGKVILHDSCHFFGRAIVAIYCIGTGVNGIGQFFKVRRGTVDDRQHTGHCLFAKQRGNRLCLFCLRKSAQFLTKLFHEFPQRIHLAGTIRQRNAVLFHSRCYRACRLCQIGDSGTQCCTSL